MKKYIIVILLILIFVAGILLFKQVTSQDKINSDSSATTAPTSDIKESLDPVSTITSDTNETVQPDESTNSEEEVIDGIDTQLLTTIMTKLKTLDYSDDEVYKMVNDLQFFELVPVLVFNHITDVDAYIQDCKNHRDTNSEDYFILSNNYVDYLDEGIQVTDSDSISILVNKHYYLNSSYNPTIIAFSADYARDNMGLRQEAYDEFIKMSDAAKKEGLKIYGTSAYRSYARQKTLYDGYVSKWGVVKADAVSARPGFSEHQTGLAIDLTVDGGLDSFTDTNEFVWMKANSYKYGFILRYPENKTSITGYSAESWHYRYVGVELAAKVKASHLTFDEYYALYLS